MNETHQQVRRNQWPLAVLFFSPWRWWGLMNNATRSAVGLVPTVMLYVLLEAPLFCAIKTYPGTTPIDETASRLHTILYTPMIAVHLRSPALRRMYKELFIASCRLTGDNNSYPEFDRDGWKVSYTEYSTF